MKSKKHRIVCITFGDTHKEYVVERRNWFGKWVNMFDASESFNVSFKTMEDAEKAYASLVVDPIVEVVKEF